VKRRIGAGVLSFALQGPFLQDGDVASNGLEELPLGFVNRLFTGVQRFPDELANAWLVATSRGRNRRNVHDEPPAQAAALQPGKRT
jgi:hypothetical protein